MLSPYYSHSWFALLRCWGYNFDDFLLSHADMNTQQVWQAVLGELELSISKANFTTWFKGTFILELDEKSAVIGVPNAFTKSWLEKKYTSDILSALRNITNNQVLRTIAYKVESIKKAQTKLVDAVRAPEEAEGVVASPKAPAQLPQRTQEPATVTAYGINSKYTFSNFVVGKGNELAKAASAAVAQGPGQTYNPLFIYGGAGLGKTHLLQAIGNEIILREPNRRVLYITFEKFTNDFINAVTTGKAAKFKDLYRSVDVLLIDDIQFITGKEQTQEEFFHTFNHLHQGNKQIVLSADRPPKSIVGLENRLLTRFEWGMIADISQPDLETRIAILRNKINEKGYELTPEVVQYLASNIQSNIRELEGALNRIIAYHQLNALTPNLENVKKIISGLTSNMQKRSLTPKEIIQTVSAFYDIPITDIVGKCREKRLVTPRQIIMFLMREEMKCSFPTIGQELGGRDHTTAMHAVTKVRTDYEGDEKTRREIEQIKQRLYNL